MNKPIIPWMGGKSRLVKDIVPLFPRHTCYVEPFAGGAAVFFAKQPSKVEVLNDIDGELVNLYRVVKHHLEEFVHQFNFGLVSRQMFQWAEMTQPETLTDVQRAARYYFVVRTCFGARMSSPTFGTGTTAPPKLRIGDVQSHLEGSWARLSVAIIEHLPWSECVAKYDRAHTLFYMDPPYWETAGYGVKFGMDEYLALAQAMASMRGKAILSVNDHPTMREVFGAFTVSSVGTSYSIGRAGRTPRSELIVTNFGGLPGNGVLPL